MRRDPKSLCPFKIGEEIICIETIDHVSRWVVRDTDERIIEVLATCDKTYKVTLLESKTYDNIAIKGDHGFKFQPNWKHFVTLKEYRKLKLIKLNQK